MWVGYYIGGRGDSGGDVDFYRLRAYDVATRTRDASRDVDVPWYAGLCTWSDGETLWLTYSNFSLTDNALVPLDMESGAIDSTRTLEWWHLRRPSNDSIENLFVVGRTMWVSDHDHIMHAYDSATGAYEPSRAFSLKIWGMTEWIGPWAASRVLMDGRTMFVLANKAVREPALFAYDWVTKSRVPDRDVPLLPGGRPYYYSFYGRGWSDGATVWLLGTAKRDRSGAVAEKHYYRVFAFDLRSGTHVPDRDLHVEEELIAEGGATGGATVWPFRDLWSDGEMLWVLGEILVDGDPNAEREYGLFAFDLGTGTREPAQDLMGLPGPGPFVSDGVTLWIPDGLRAYDRRLLAYAWPGGGGGGGGGGGFTDPVFVPGESAIRAVHATELRQRINAIRIRFGLPGFLWTDATIVAGVTPIRAVHFMELRTALDQAYAAAGRIHPAYTDLLLGAGTHIKWVHIDELRRAVMLLE